MNSIWTWLDGKKTVIGAVLANVVPWFVIKGSLNGDTAAMVMGVVNAVTGVGLAHKAMKARDDSSE